MPSLCNENRLTCAHEDKGPLLAISYLAISGGGENGAFGEVVLLRDMQGWGAAEICGLLGITECNRRVLLHRVRSRIRAELERHFAV